jgi:hypothetical protein
VGVAGLNVAKSSFRLRGFYGTNKLKLNQPIINRVYSGAADPFDYYWFVITDAVADAKAQFEYQVSVATSG